MWKGSLLLGMEWSSLAECSRCFSICCVGFTHQFLDCPYASLVHKLLFFANLVTHQTKILFPGWQCTTSSPNVRDRIRLTGIWLFVFSWGNTELVCALVWYLLFLFSMAPFAFWASGSTVSYSWIDSKILYNCFNLIVAFTDSFALSYPQKS